MFCLKAVNVYKCCCNLTTFTYWRVDDLRVETWFIARFSYANGRVEPQLQKGGTPPGDQSSPEIAITLTCNPTHRITVDFRISRSPLWVPLSGLFPSRTHFSIIERKSRRESRRVGVGVLGGVCSEKAINHDVTTYSNTIVGRCKNRDVTCH